MSGASETVEAAVSGVALSVEQVNTFSRSLLPTRAEVFDRVSVRPPEFGSTPELAFVRATSWIYVLYFEAGRASITYLSRGNDDLKAHQALVRSLRTWSHHNLDPTSDRDTAVEKTCTDWFRQCCGTRLPREGDHWTLLCLSLLVEAGEFLDDLLVAISEIESDPDCVVLVDDWERSLSRNWPAHRFHTLISSVSSDAGFSTIDPVAFHDRYGATFREQLRLLDDGCDLDSEMRKLIEIKLITESEERLPCTGQDVMEHLGIGPGPEVGQLLRRAKAIFDLTGPCSKDELLTRLAIDRDQ